MTKFKYLMVLLSAWFKRLFRPKNQYPAIDGDSFVQRRNTAHIFFVHSGLTALMANLYIKRYQIPLEHIYVIHVVTGKNPVKDLFKQLVNGDESRIFGAGDLANNFWNTLSDNPKRIRKYYFKHFNRFLKSTLAYIGEADFVAVCNNLDQSVARAFYEHAQCCKLVLCEEGTSSYIPSLGVMSLAPDYNEKIQNFVAKHPKWAYQRSKLIPAKFISHYNVLEIYNPRLIKDNKIEIFRLTDLAYQHLEASWREAIDTLPTMSAESAQSTASNITKERERERETVQVMI